MFSTTEEDEAFTIDDGGAVSDGELTGVSEESIGLDSSSSKIFSISGPRIIPPALKYAGGRSSFKLGGSEV